MISGHVNPHSAAVAGGTNSYEKWCATFTKMLSFSKNFADHDLVIN
ncbi:hypothetical protein DOT_6116 [Desulfosporosinus sp. OT]|nr:hypothetical protein DOT_6116 [Desulfosporosinus sp. OT]